MYEENSFDTMFLMGWLPLINHWKMLLKIGIPKYKTLKITFREVTVYNWLNSQNVLARHVAFFETTSQRLVGCQWMLDFVSTLKWWNR